GLLDQDRTAVSRRVVDALTHSDVFVAGPVARTPDELEGFLTHDRARVTLWIPRYFERDVLEGHQPEVAIAVDGRNSSLAGRAAGYAQAVVTREVMRVRAEEGVASPAAAAAASPPVRIDGVTRFFYNPELESRYYMVPGILVLLITIVSTLLTGLAVVREKELGTFEQILVTPLTPGQLVAGKTVPFAIITFGELTFATIVAKLWFHLPLQGSLFTLILGVGAYLLVTLGIGLLVSTISSTQQQAMFSVWFFMTFAILMSGFFYPIENMPTWAQWLSAVDPLRYTMYIVRGVFLRGAGFLDLWHELAVLAGFGLVVFTAAVQRFQKRIA
ncbi:MAG TPA: ABC transporter permease, partial [Chromatiales bacterium]|nr:ABC transporter permease [Chromatiales bacterium]